MSADKFSNSENPAWIAAQRALQKIGAETDPVVNGGMSFTPPVGFPYGPHYQPYYSGISTAGHNNIQAGFPTLDLSLYNSQKPNLSFVKPKVGNNLGKVQYQARGTISKGLLPPSVQNTVSEISQQNYLGNNKAKTFFQNGTQAPGVPTIKFNPTKKPVGLLLPSQLVNEDCDYPLISKVSHPPLRNYILRAFKSLPNPNQKHKLLNYLEERVTPLIESGATKAVNWDSEPLPHEVGFIFETFSFSKTQKRPAPPVNMPAKKSMVGMSLDSNFTGPDILLSGAKITKNKSKNLKDDQINGPVADKLKEKRAKRFATELGKNNTISPIKFFPTNNSSPIYFLDTKGNNSYKFSEISMDENFVGTSTELERRYLRLTERPRPDQVRPEAVLKKSINHVLGKYYKTKNYDYAGGQLKSIRQDLCVQNIRNPFAIYVYEECAKVAIENGDKEEFNQSQQQLRQLYSLNPNTNNEANFFGYNLLFLLYTNNPMDINKWMQNLTRDKKNNKVYKIYPRFFELYHQSPDATSKHLINIYLDRERCNALKIILSAYQVYIPLEVISENLRYEINELREWLKAKDIETVPNKEGKEVIECKKYINNARTMDSNTESVKKIKSKKRKIKNIPSASEVESYLKELPKCDSYEKSFMHRSNITHVLSTLTDFIITASKDGILKFWKKTHHQGIEFVKAYKCHSHEFIDLQDNHNGTLLATLSTEDKSAKIFDVSNFDMTNILSFSFKPFSCAWLDRSRDVIKALAVSDIETGTVYVFDSSDSKNILKIFERMHRSPYTKITYSPTLDIAISVDSKGILEYWSGIQRNFEFPDSDVKFSSKLSTDLLIHMKEKVKVYNICCSSNGQYFATFSSDFKYRVFKTLSGKLLSVFDESLEFCEKNPLDYEELNISSMDLARKKAVEKEILNDNYIVYTIKMKFDYNNTILVYPLLRMIGTSEVMRFCSVDICNAHPFNEHLMQSVATVRTDQCKDLSEKASEPDPLIVASALSKNRFYLFTNCEPSTRDDKNSTDNRDIVNEKMVEEIVKPVVLNEIITDSSEIREKAIIHTSKGDIHVQLFLNECPKAVQNFCTHAYNGYYDGHIFHRVIKNFIIQTGDPTGKGTGGESIWGGEFEDEFHHSLKFDAPYKLVAPTEWLDGKNTLFGSVIDGFNVVNSINKVQTQEKSGRPYENINVISISLL
ncbi:WD40 repeat and Cyclophilin-type peptidyl-prolyl cis-trans isomerase domain and SAC3/GANP/Nin1/mts3/eIF-3 p25 family and WD40/YVTN repeat-like-containing domain and WD40-repeat-containing domain-containing protein [Strongyloides ratti]|uniref:PPIase cyclophilin-type domain-containing protein n=1 Tax=Strongyloides ratti TaxID=34506 RepID=A0A090L8K9_STRRB|nr:WD40 repeat and Cyclophilin-type peptidyl-prolyl cis-trans isomerase domain and SAC3/GANP/Nin1/mts3/eIF-3 p25 family and WD40/YVTN repeat-like-containing domain and WD40-repeat-containing domain-containing protein [Strongyloides ratti]CEF63820.1 WD40 repeat and Cyclophilin-type peptidyl-prolyl cis-trans isomerase domain and SAC3/GANP/Nin1/mts3/eIF-3 p25 family and WD40/YVTN repeat-like-containing domain and WD40-repeat-containing domain-containing protein [Strongyloides ratti]